MADLLVNDANAVGRCAPSPHPPPACGGGKGGGQPFGKKYFLTLSPSVLNITAVPRNWRICLLVRLIMPWRLRDWANSTLPDPVTLKRFLAPDLVFILGIWLSFAGGRLSRHPGL